MDNIYKAVQLTIDSQNLALSKTPTHVYIANQYVDTNDTPLITAPFIIQKALEHGTGVVDIVSSTIGSIYEVRLLCDAEVLISGYFYMPPMNAKFSELELYTSYPPRTPPVVNEFWQKTENFILEKTNTLLNFVQVFNSLSSMRLSLGYLEELLTTKKSNLVSAINEVYKKYEDVGSLYEKNVAAGAGANGWTTDLVGENGLTQKQINGTLKTPLNFNVPTNELVNANTALASLFDVNGKHIMMLQKRTYLIDKLTVPPNTILYGNGAILKRSKGTGAPILTVGAGSVVIGVIVDGDEDNIGNQLWNNDIGIHLDNGAVAFGCVARNCHGHGFKLTNDSKAIVCNSYNNGREGGNGAKWGNWGDGFNMTNTSRAQLLFCQAYGNYRTGIVATTATGADWHIEPTLSVGISVTSSKAWDNYYSDANFEGVSKVTITDLDAKNGLTFRESPDVVVNGMRGSTIYAQSSDNATVSNIIIERDNTSDALFFSGKNLKLSNVTVRGKEGVTQSGIALEAMSPDGSGSISNVKIINAFNAYRTNVRNVTNIEWEGVSNTPLRYEDRIAVYSDFISVIDGKISYRSFASTIPTSGAWVYGDTIYNKSSTGDYAVVCTVTGRATDTAWVSGGTATLGSYIYYGSNVYLVTTAGTFDTVPPTHTSGTSANGTAQLQYVSSKAQFKTIAYKVDDLMGVASVVPSSITNANDARLNGKFYWVESILTNMPLPTSGGFTKANIKTYNSYRLTGNFAVTQEVQYPNLNEKWIRGYDGGAGSWTTWTLVCTKNDSGTTANRPSGNVPVGFKYFDTTLGKPVYLKATGTWVDASGAAA